MDPKDFYTIQDYVTKANELRGKLKDCRIDKNDAQLVYNLLDKLPSEYAAFVSRFHTHRLAQGSSYTSPLFDSFTKMLILEQSKLTTMGILKSSKSQDLVGNKGNQSNQGKGKDHKQPKSKPQQDGAKSSSPQQGDSPFWPKRKPYKDNIFCGYCKKLGHDEHHCYKKDIDELKNILEKNKINLPSRMSTLASSKDKGKDHSFGTYKGKGKALCATTSHDSGRWLLDSGASHHMASSQSMFSTFEPCHMPQILMGNHTYMDVIGKTSIAIGDNSFNDVFCVPHLTNNILSIYQITHGETRKTVEFTPNSLIIRDLESGENIATRVVDHESRLYSFSHFGPIDEVDSSYVDDSNFEENIGHLNLGILTCHPVLEPFISYPSLDIKPPIALDDAISLTVLPSCDSV